MSAPSKSQYAPDIPVEPWTPPKETTHGDEIHWAPLYTLDLSQVQGENWSEVPEQVVKDTGDALANVGFIYAENHGLDQEDILRQYALGKHSFEKIADADKEAFTADIVNSGSYCGYKQVGHWKIDDVADRIEQWNFGSAAYEVEAAKKKYPASLHPFLDEIHEFARFNHDVVVRKVLTVLSLVLKLPYDYLWNLSKKYETEGDDFLRYMLVHRPPQEDDAASKGVRIQGHTDFGSVTLLWSQPIASLEVLGKDNVWRTVRHKPNALIVNLGDSLHFLSGGYLRATIHRVVAPPEDQLQYARLNVLYFSMFDNDVKLLPIEESPVAREAAKTHDFWSERIRNGEPVPTSKEWNGLRISRYGQKHSKLGADGHHHETIAGHDVTLYNDTQPKNRQFYAQPQPVAA
ncbi:hypothetical protein MOBT1_002775 [Malassezia obtusa]|uniref:Clavaminate synthase-like protein n=1 Tax=Malassezia obtusa TaxID=76774 RepID=A0AAF0E2A5_9BASI|nr:hypothetical protein MOBT1_002775 [Malassezia obtusa]